LKSPWPKRLLQAVLFGGGLFVLWLFAVWPPPVWYRSHWPAETAFQAERRGSAGAQKYAPRDSGKRVALQREWCAIDLRLCTPAPLRLYRPVPLDSISEWMPQAAMTGEDQRFPDHGWIDWVNLRRALGYPRDQFSWKAARDRKDRRTAVSQVWAHRAALRGASTINQQLAKNLYFSS